MLGVLCVSPVCLADPVRQPRQVTADLAEVVPDLRQQRVDLPKPDDDTRMVGRGHDGVSPASSTIPRRYTRSGCGPGGPGGPCSPRGPGGPAGPRSPLGPGGPAGPRSPRPPTESV